MHFKSKDLRDDGISRTIHELSTANSSRYKHSTSEPMYFQPRGNFIELIALTIPPPSPVQAHCTAVSSNTCAVERDAPFFRFPPSWRIRREGIGIAHKSTGIEYMTAFIRHLVAVVLVRQHDLAPSCVNLGPAGELSRSGLTAVGNGYSRRAWS